MDTVNTLSSAGELVKKPYAKPALQQYGTVSALTQNGSPTGAQETNCGINNPKGPTKPSCSQRSYKENIVQVGRHPLGFGLYLFDYKPEYVAAMGSGRRFGVMIDEVQPIVPHAIGVREDGYSVVDYDMLGISLAVH